jgi:hypothetical protein
MADNNHGTKNYIKEQGAKKRRVQDLFEGNLNDEHKEDRRRAHDCQQPEPEKILHVQHEPQPDSDIQNHHNKDDNILDGVVPFRRLITARYRINPHDPPCCF